MAKQHRSERLLLRWSDHVPASDVADPLGLGLRGSARLAGRLLFCITSVTPRARYYSFIPWCVLDYQKRERGKSFSTGLRNAIVYRERALTLSCIVHHGGGTCRGGAVVGSDRASLWFARKEPLADFTRKPLDFAKNAAMQVYLNSLVNLGCFVTDDERQSENDEDEVELTFEDIELSPLGRRLAEAYDSMIGSLSSVKTLSTAERHCSVESLTEWGRRGGICEVSSTEAADRQTLREMFFAQVPTRGDSHPVRKQSLLLLIELVRQLSTRDIEINERRFMEAVYFDSITTRPLTAVEWPDRLRGIATRWRMFYFHQFMSVALEGMLAWLLTSLVDRGISGATLAELTAGLDAPSLSTQLSDLLHQPVSRPFGTLTPAGFVELLGITGDNLTAVVSAQLDEAIRPDSPLAESQLEALVRGREHRHTAAGLALPMILLTVTLARYARWRDTDYGNWLGRAAVDPYLDLIPPVVLLGLDQRFDDWWNTPFSELAQAVLSRFVVQQHVSMSYEKSQTGAACLLQIDGSTVSATGTHDTIGMGNPRFRSAVRILKDLALLSDTDDPTVVTPDGLSLLASELSGGQVE